MHIILRMICLFLRFLFLLWAIHIKLDLYQSILIKVCQTVTKKNFFWPKNLYSIKEIYYVIEETNTS